MAPPRKSQTRLRASTPRKTARPSFRDVLRSANDRAHERANRRTGSRGQRSIHAAIADASPIDEDEEGLPWLRRLARQIAALLLLPLCWVTTWTLLSRFSHATLERGFWQTDGFWYFATGALLMIGWFFSGLARPVFLYLYVLGHELTHAVFVILFFGRVTGFKVGLEGGYITTNKTNLLIALSPYFVPFWSLVVTVVYAVGRIGFEAGHAWDLAFYAFIGASWMFHFVWTVWMIPRDQPDLRQNGTFLSLVIIYLANLIVLVALLCLADGSPAENAAGFGREWIRHAITWSGQGWQWLDRWIADLVSRILLTPTTR